MFGLHIGNKPKGIRATKKDFAPRDNMTLWYCQSAEDNYFGWEKEALPIGNGYMGAKIFGIVRSECIQLNEKTIWTGSTLGHDGCDNGNGNGDMGKSVKAVQDLLLEKKYPEATKAMEKLQGDEIGLGTYQNFGEIRVDFHDLCTEKKCRDYIRDLGLKNAISHVEFFSKEIKYSREYFASYPHNVICAKFNSDSQNAVVRFAPAQQCTVTSKGDEIIISGEMKNGTKPRKYYAVIKVVTDGELSAKDNQILVSNAHSIKLFTTIKSNYAPVYPDYVSDIDVEKCVNDTIKKAVDDGYDAVKKLHIEDYKRLFSRCEIDIGQSNHTIPTDMLLYKYKKGRLSKALEMLLFQYGRYLLISSSRIGSLPANLQGVWCGNNEPVWQSDYHLNINLQMNYWPAMSSNLSETLPPLIDFVNNCLVVPGRATAHKWLGIGDGDVTKATGWMAGTQNNIFGHTGTGSSWRWGWAPTAGAFILENTFEYYLFSKDIEALANDIYPAMEESALMWSQMLIEDKTYDRLVSAPCFSPEHGSVSLGNTFDQELVWQLYYNVIAASKALIEAGKDELVNKDIINTISKQIHRLKPRQIGEWGQIKEWIEEDSWPNRGKAQGVALHHRHMSHLLGLYPGNSITGEKADLIGAAKVSLNDRGDDGQGWSMAQKIGAWARLFDGNRSYKMLRQLLTKNILWNMWDSHPPFQIDGNFGATAGICEMLLQSHASYIELLPALPDCWSKKGRFKGLVARGNHAVDCHWKDGKVVYARIKAENDCTAKIKINNEVHEVSISKDNPYIFEV